MKRIFSAVLLAIVACGSGLFAEIGVNTPKIAILSPNTDKDIDADTANIIVDKIGEPLVASRKFIVVDRASRDQIWKERNFQITSGEIDSSQIKEIGKGLGAAYVVTVKVKKIGSTFSMTATMINVETLEVIAQASGDKKGDIDVILELGTLCGSLLVDRAFATDGVIIPSIAGSAGVSATKAATSTAPAADAGSATQSPDSINRDMLSLLGKQAFMNALGRAKISLLGGNLSYMQKQNLYEGYKYNDGNMWGTMLADWFLGFGIGSFFQGDAGSGWAMLLLDLASIACLVDYSVSDNSGSLAIWLACGLVSKIWAIAGPVGYRNKWNDNLKKGLNYPKVSFETGRMVPVAATGPDGAGGIAYSPGVSLASLRY